MLLRGESLYVNGAKYYAPVLVRVLLLLILAITVQAQWFDEEEQTHYEFVRNFEINGGRSSERLGRRAEGVMRSTRAPPLILQFDAQGNRFVIRLREHENILGDHSIVRTHGLSDEAIDVPITGGAYVGERMIVIDHESLMSKFGGDSSKLVNLEQQEGVSVLDGMFGRFYIDRTPEFNMINGGFIYNGAFLSVQNAAHPLSKHAAKHIKSKSSNVNDNDLIISVQELNKMEAQISRNARNCGHDHLEYNRRTSGAISFFARKVIENGVIEKSPKLHARYSSGCPSIDKVVYMGVVADCSYLEVFDGDIEKAKANIINDFNLASAIYEDNFNIHLGLLSIDLMTKCDKGDHFNVPCSLRITLDERLSRFSKWRGTQSANAGLYHLVSGCSQSRTVGIAWLNQVCQVKPVTSAEGENVAGAAVTVFLKNQFSVIAHEIAHNFGAVHDCDREACLVRKTKEDSQCCPCDKGCDCRGKYIMDPESGGRNVNRFSDCTVKDICHKVPILASCLQEPGTLKTITNSECGNGIKEEGEECDCGGPEGCKGNPCCNEDCTLKAGATCSDDHDRCCKNCRIISAQVKHICTPSKGRCQVESYCDGISEKCPKTQSLPDGTFCDDDESTCASGQCTSRRTQCLAVGTRLGFKGDCPDYNGSCTMVCMTAKGCIALDAQFVDGTPCGYSGKCYGGECSEAFWITLAWRHVLLISIIIALLAIGLLVLIIKTLMGYCYRS